MRPSLLCITEEKKKKKGNSATNTGFKMSFLLMKGENSVSCCVVLTSKSVAVIEINENTMACQRNVTFAEVLNRLFMDDDMGMYEVDELDNSWEPDFE